MPRFLFIFICGLPGEGNESSGFFYSFLEVGVRSAEQLFSRANVLFASKFYPMRFFFSRDFAIVYFAIPQRNSFPPARLFAGALPRFLFKDVLCVTPTLSPCELAGACVPALFLGQASLMACAPGRATRSPERASASSKKTKQKPLPESTPSIRIACVVCSSDGTPRCYAPTTRPRQTL